MRRLETCSMSGVGWMKALNAAADDVNAKHKAPNHSNTAQGKQTVMPMPNHGKLKAAASKTNATVHLNKGVRTVVDIGCCLVHDENLVPLKHSPRKAQ